MQGLNYERFEVQLIREVLRNEEVSHGGTDRRLVGFNCRCCGFLERI
jgi:hypothetical protein